MNRDEMEAVIKAGGSVIHNGHLYSTVDSLPSKADLARGNPEAEAAASADLQKQIAAMQAQLDKLTAKPAKDAK